MAGNNPENGPKVIIGCGPSTAGLGTGEDGGGNEIVHLPGIGIRTRKQIVKALNRTSSSFMSSKTHGEELVEDLGISHEELHQRLETELGEEALS